MSALPLVVDRDDRENSELQQLLAVHELRRDLERRASHSREPRALRLALAAASAREAPGTCQALRLSAYI